MTSHWFTWYTALCQRVQTQPGIGMYRLIQSAAYIESHDLGHETKPCWIFYTMLCAKFSLECKIYSYIAPFCVIILYHQLFIIRFAHCTRWWDFSCVLDLIKTGTYRTFARFLKLPQDLTRGRITHATWLRYPHRLDTLAIQAWEYG